jgi:hypothetical protein
LLVFDSDEAQGKQQVSSDADMDKNSIALIGALYL